MSRRPDAMGLIWEDLPKVKGKGARTARERGPHPAIPETGWRPPTDWPNLAAARVIGFDVESYDPELLTAGPGWARKSGHLIGISLAVDDGTSWYFPFAHETQKEFNMDKSQVMAFCGHYLKTSVPKVGANLIYDIGWLKEEGIEVGGKLYDVQFAEALLDSEVPDVDLDSLASPPKSNPLHRVCGSWLWYHFDPHHGTISLVVGGLDVMDSDCIIWVDYDTWYRQS